MIETFPPDIICIGAQKACTSWLNLVLKSDANKSIFIPYLKETFYLNLIEGTNSKYPIPMSELHGDIYKMFKRITESHIHSELWSIYSNGIQPAQAEYLEYLFGLLQHYWTGLNSTWYDKLYAIAQPGQLLGDITPDYSLIESSLIKELAAYKPSLKIILITRDPVARDLSQLKMQLLPMLPSPTDQECIDFLQQQHVRERSNYRSIINTWSSYFPPQSILTFDTAEVSSDPFAVLAKISSFLGVNLDVDASVLLAKDNVNSAVWHPSDFVVTYLNDYYGHQE